MGDPLTQLDPHRAVAVLHRYSPEDVGQVELDLEVSLVRDRMTALNRSAAGAVYQIILVRGERPVLGVDLVCCQPVDLGLGYPVTLAYRHGHLLGASWIP